MVFSSVIFLCVFLPLFLAGYWLCPAKFKNIFLLGASVAFYAWGAPKFIFVILVTTTVDFYLVQAVYNATNARNKKMLLIASLSLNLGMLFYFKYCNFFIDNVNMILAQVGIKELTWTKIVLPIGISFYTFESVTYMVDVYRGIHKPLSNFLNYQLYILLFPKLIAGPIIRYHEIGHQIEDRSSYYNEENRLSGLYRFVIGLSKKVLIANVMAAKADEIFALTNDDFTTPVAWAGMFAYTMQIYFDFSGYSDMAIGIGKMIGFRFPENFDNPYTAIGITDFWRRWHITLGSWMRNYLYIPLGGNKVESQKRLYFNLWIVFLASGFWHGASWNFIIWGAYHGLFLVLERMFLSGFYKKIGSFLSVLFTLLIVSVGWVIFRANSFSQAMHYYKGLISFKFGSLIYFDYYFIFISFLAIVFSLFVLFPKAGALQQKIFFEKYSLKNHLIAIPCCLLLFFICLASITGSNFNPFIYFRF